MMQYRWMVAAFIAVTFASAVGSVPGYSQTSCPDGRLSSGGCANPASSTFMRRSSIGLSQLKLSYTGIPLRADLNGPGDLSTQRGRDLTFETSGFGGQPVPSSVSPGTFVYIPPGVNPAGLQIQQPFIVVPGGIILR